MAELPTIQTSDLAPVYTQVKHERGPSDPRTADPKTTAVAAAPLLILRTEREMVLPAFLVAFLGSPESQAFLRQAAVGTYVPQVPRQAAPCTAAM